MYDEYLDDQIARLQREISARQAELYALIAGSGRAGLAAKVLADQDDDIEALRGLAVKDRMEAQAEAQKVHYGSRE